MPTNTQTFNGHIFDPEIFYYSWLQEPPFLDADGTEAYADALFNMAKRNDTFILLNGETVRGNESGIITSNTLKDYLVGYSPHDHSSRSETIQKIV